MKIECAYSKDDYLEATSECDSHVCIEVYENDQVCTVILTPNKVRELIAGLQVHLDGYVL